MLRKLVLSAVSALLLFILVLIAWVVTVDPEQPDGLSDSELSIAFDQTSHPLALGQTNVVLIIGCTVRKDHLGLYGYDRPTTPFLKQWAKHSITFDAHIGQAPWTRPSIGSIITGRYPRVLKLDNPNKGRSFRMVLKDDFVTVAEAFQSKGYQTIGAVGNPNAKVRFGMGQGFNHYNEPDKTFRKQVSLPSGGELVEDVLSQTKGLDRPFFAQLVFVDSHLPVQAPLRFQPLFRDLRKRLREYDASLRKLDGHIAQLVAGIRSEHPNTLFVLTADHGEGLNQPKHHGVGHGKNLYQSVIALPHLWMHPSFDTPGRRVDSITRNIDILPTLMDLFDVSSPWTMDGESIAKVLLDSSAQLPQRPAFTETYFKKETKASVVYGDSQLIRNRKSNDEQLFEVKDVFAKVDRIQADLPTAVLLRGQLNAWEIEVARLAAEAGDAVEAPMDAETQKTLEAMGYVE